MQTHYTIDDIRRANDRAGFHFFEAGVLRFFGSRIGQTAYNGPGGVFFVTSEQFRGSGGYVTPRRYTVRTFDPETGSVGTFGEFNRLSRSEANTLARKLASG